MLPRATRYLVWASFFLVILIAFPSNFIEASTQDDCSEELHFKCSEGGCISRSFVCDGERDCPYDRSDEDEKLCQREQVFHSKVECKDHQFKCEDGNCIEKDWICDKVEDCPDGTDENQTMCANLTSTCDGIFCEQDKKCISNTFVCDGSIDCRDGSDEMNCDSWILPSPECKFTNQMFTCNDEKRCLHFHQVCNGKQDCLDGSDEGGHCTETTCDSQCHHLCKSFPDGPQCVCPRGESLDTNGICNDINECISEQHFAFCDQICENSPGSYTCSCKDGYSRENRTCKADGGEAMLLFATEDEVRLFYLTSHVYDRVATNVNRSSAVTYDGVHAYWATYANGEEAIYRATEIGTDMQMIFTAGLGLVEDLCIDWITKNIYFTDSVKKHLAVCSRDGEKCMSLITENVDKPRALVLDSPEGVMYFSDWGTNPRITKVGMDGSSLVAIVTENIVWPNGLAIDHGTDRLYWADAKTGHVEYVNFDGSNRKAVQNIKVNHPYSIDIFEDTFYWSDMNDHEIHSCNKLTGRDCHIVLRHAKESILGIHVYHPVILGKNIKNPCVEAKCSDLCLLAPKSFQGLHYTCMCPEGMELSSNKHSCTQLEKSQYIIAASGFHLYLVFPKSLGKFEIQEIDSHKVPHIGPLAYDSLADNIIMAEESTNTLTIFDLSTNAVKGVYHANTSEISAMDFDNLGNNIFWIDSSKKTAGVMSLNTFESTVLIKDFGGETPLAISLFVEDGIMYIALRNDDSNIHIDQFSLDGSLEGRIRRVTEHFVGPVISMFFDGNSHRLFWSDMGTGQIKSVDKDGGDVHEHHRVSYSTVFQVTSVGNDIFYTKMHTDHLFWISKTNFGTPKHMKLGELKSDQPLRIIRAGGSFAGNRDGCNVKNGGCSHVCLMIQGRQECKCPEKMSISDDGKTCLQKKNCEPDEFMCSNGLCLPMHLKCDTKQDCPSGEDEQLCLSYTCPLGTFACKDGRECIDNHLVCNSMPNCIDGSDEFEEGCGTKRECSPAEFRCNSGQCIHIAWRCDEKSDCSDGSDETGCEVNRCGETHFKCLSGLCIPSSWECDGAVDCNDMSDEHSRCNVSRQCNQDELRCENGHCVDKNLICNGEDDCEDGSDEKHCKIKPSHPNVDTLIFQCGSDEFHCQSSNSCIPISSRCDGKAECPKGEDEKGCDGCGVNEFQCVSIKTCISIKWKCDGVNDCTDHSDEQNCPKKTSLGFQESGEVCNGIRCKDTRFCVDWKQVCNNVTDCNDHSDEGGICGSSCAKSGCDICHETPYGYHCDCPKGYRLMNDGKTCVDVDECASPTSCSQFCQNTVGSFICSCREDAYHLRADRTSCKAKGRDMEYVFATNAEIRYKSRSLTTVDLAFKSSHQLTVKGLDVDMHSRVVYWSSEVDGIVYKTPVNDANATEMIKHIIRPGKVAYDWVSGLVYFTEKDSSIRTCDFKVGKCALVHESSREVTIDALRLDGISRKLYWSETSNLGSQDAKGVLKTSDLSGSNVITLLDEGIHKVTDIAVDDLHKHLKTLYFTDSITGKIERLKLAPIVSKSTMFSVQEKPSDVNLFEGHLYWLSRRKTGGDLGSISRNNIVAKCGVSGNLYMECDYVRLLPEYSSESIQRIRVSHPALQPEGIINYCLKDEINCTHMCISEENGPVCVCEDGTHVRISQRCPPVMGLRSNLKFSSLSVENRANAPHSNNRVNGLKWFMFICSLIAFILMATYVVYYFYNQNLNKKRDFNSVHFQNPSYELDGHNQSIYEQCSLSPGEHHYENPISFKPCSDTANNNTLKITRGEDGIWPLRESRNPEEFTHVPASNSLV